jgi:hypothetical protein
MLVSSKPIQTSGTPCQFLAVVTVVHPVGASAMRNTPGRKYIYFTRASPCSSPALTPLSLLPFPSNQHHTHTRRFGRQSLNNRPFRVEDQLTTYLGHKVADAFRCSLSTKNMCAL